MNPSTKDSRLQWIDPGKLLSVAVHEALLRQAVESS